MGFMDHTPSESAVRVFEGEQLPVGAVQISIFSVRRMSTGLL